MTTRPDSLSNNRARFVRRSDCTQTQSAAGFTLIEIMVALAVVAIALVALLGLHNRNIALVARDQERTYATLLARQQITVMELVEGFPELGTDSGEFDDFPDYKWEREVQETDFPDLREVHLRITWDDSPGNRYELLYLARDHREPTP